MSVGRTSALDRAVRNLINLKASGSSSRVLNLLSVWERERDSAEWRDAPFFRNSLLNKSLILKHRLRSSERDAFAEPRTSATKVIIPLNAEDLRAGGRAFFIGQNGMGYMLEQLTGSPLSEPDRLMLERLDKLPSLDPFLMRERLRKQGCEPARCYFEVSEADILRMLEATRKEITPLITMIFDEMDAGAKDKVNKLAAKLLNNAGDADLEPLRQGMGMDRDAFEEGVFCWKGFIYYKWCLADLATKIRPVSEEIAKVRPAGNPSFEEKHLIVVARERLSRAMNSAVATVRDTLKAYEEAYAELTENRNPVAFRDFLLAAPHLFNDLGDKLGSVQHIVSFWRFRFPNGATSRVPADDLIDLLTDFEQSMELSSPAGMAA